MKKIAFAAAMLSAVVAAAGAPAAGTALYPHAYSARITGATPSLLNGTWRLAIQRTAFAVTKNGAAAIAGSVQIAGNKITFHDIGGPLACRGAQVNGTYTWKLRGATLTLTRVNDSCVGRRTVFTHSFTRIG